MTNRLKNESSPYLQQHADNPVDWYPWGTEAFAQAKQENKPIHLSVGYAACHWCHVMAHESFADARMAALLNTHFVNIKVDRQERPDVDDVYQKVVQMMGMGGGWPLTVFLTPDGEPFFGGTYFPPVAGYGRPSFTSLILGLAEAWKTGSHDLARNIQQFRDGFLRLDQQVVNQPSAIPADLPLTAARYFADTTDPVWGGLGGAPKFPNPSCYDLMLRVFQRTKQPDVYAALEITLNAMACGGIYDHLGGGFSRYSVDDTWSVPHFEKMLYDNGQLVKLYADAYRTSGNPAWRRVLEDSIDYVCRDLMHAQGGFYAAEDADSEGEEGKFYVWRPEEVSAVLDAEDSRFACRAYGISEHGNFEHGATVISRPVALTEAEEQRLHGIRAKLLSARAKRPRPMRDENIITGWNGLMIQGLCAAYQATGTKKYLATARRAADFILAELSMTDQGVFRVWNAGRAQVPGFLEDYAFLINALLDLYESSLESRYLHRALQLVNLALDKFWDDGFFFTPKDAEQLVHRPRAPYDNAWPSGLSTMAFALLRAYELTHQTLYRERAAMTLQQYSGAAADNYFGFAHLIAAMEFSHQKPFSIVLAGTRTAVDGLLEAIHRAYIPSRVIAHADDVPTGNAKPALDGKPTAYVCQASTCFAPTTDPDKLRAVLE